MSAWSLKPSSTRTASEGSGTDVWLLLLRPGCLLVLLILCVLALTLVVLVVTGVLPRNDQCADLVGKLVVGRCA